MFSLLLVMCANKQTFLLPIDLTESTMKRANEGLQKQCEEKEEVAFA